MISVLHEIKALPQKITDPDWLQTLEGDGDGKRGK